MEKDKLFSENVENLEDKRTAYKFMKDNFKSIEKLINEGHIKKEVVHIINREGYNIKQDTFRTYYSKIKKEFGLSNTKKSTIDSKYVGSSFDDFLEKEGIYTETYKLAIKRFLAFQIFQMMQNNNISKREMASKMRISRNSFYSFLNPQNNSVTLSTLNKAANILGKSIKLEIVDASNDNI